MRELEKGNWRKISSSTISQKEGKIVVEISSAEIFSILLLGDDFGEAKNYLKNYLYSNLKDETRERRLKS